MKPLRILANENIPLAAIESLRGRGHDVVWMREGKSGAPDIEVLSLAQHDSRILITFDKDFGELVFRQRCEADIGVVLFRFESSSAADAARRIVISLESREVWGGSFSVIESDRIRMTPLPD